VRNETDAAGIELRSLTGVLARRAIQVGQPRDSSLPGRAVVSEIRQERRRCRGKAHDS
jgi:hypothetical protein